MGYKVRPVSGGPSANRTANSGGSIGYGSASNYPGAYAPDTGKHNPQQGTIGYRLNAPRWEYLQIFYEWQNTVKKFKTSAKTIASRHTITTSSST